MRAPRHQPHTGQSRPVRAGGRRGDPAAPPPRLVRQPAVARPPSRRHRAPRRRARLRPVGTADPRRRRRRPTSTSSACPATRCTVCSATPSPKARHPTSPCSTTSGRRSSRAAGFLHPLDDLDSRWVRREHDVDFLASLAAADRYGGQTFGVSAFAEMAGLVVQPAQAARARPRCSDDVERVDQRGPGAAGHPVGCAAGAARWHRRRRDHLLLPDRVPRLQRRQRARRPTASASDRPPAPRRCASCAGSSPTAACPRPPSATSGTARSTCSPTVRRRSSIGGTYEAETLALSAPVPDRRGVWDHFGFAPIPAGPQRPASQRRRGDDLRRVPPGRAAQGRRCS